MRRLVLVRHAESLWNASGRVQGQRCEGLSELGHEQARVTAVALAAAFPDAALVTSDLRRARETMRPLEVALHRTASTEVALRERSFGAWEGRHRSDIEVEDADLWHRWRAGEDLISEIGGETAADLADRAVPALLQLLGATPPGGVTVVVSHGGTIHHGMHRLLRLAAGTLGGVANTAIAELLASDEFVAGEQPASDGRAAPPPVRLDRWNEVGHLPADLRTAWYPRIGVAHASRAGQRT